MSKSKIFITGIAGFLGCNLANRFIEAGYEVAGCDNLLGGYMDNVPTNAEFYESDCTDFVKMQKIIKGSDIVYHCAAAPYEGLSVFSPHIITKNIVDASVSVISAAISNNVKRFVYCSSMARYGENEVPFLETMDPKPQDPYGIAKVAGEDILKCLSDLHKMEYVIAIPHNIYGPRQKYDDPFRNVASIMSNLMLTGRQPIIYGDGSQMRCFSYIEDDIKILFELAFTNHLEIVNSIINIGPDEEFVSIYELSEIIAEIIGFELDPIYYPGRPLEVKYATCSAEKARRTLNYKTEYSLKDGLIDMINWIKDRGVKPFQYHIDLEIVNEFTPKTWTEKKF